MGDEKLPKDDPKFLFDQLYKKASSLGLQGEDLAKLSSLNEIKTSRVFFISFEVVRKFCFAVTGALFAFLLVWCLDWPVTNEQFVTLWFRMYNVNPNEIIREPCLVEMFEDATDMLRPPLDCSYCRDIKEFHRVKDITQEEFEKKYAYSGQPVIITDAMKNWTAHTTFTFDFFKGVYSKDSPALQNVEANCQFFPYKTDFDSLGDVFEMDRDRAYMKDGSKPWYIGWSNCDFSVGNILRQHYSRPYFLPNSSESSRTDWIFMGSPGYGANLHIDHVSLPSWQAQVTGTKRWTLEPPPECYFVCERQISTVVHPGEIIVLDTNKWYHSTLNVGNDISITIGSEYD